MLRPCDGSIRIVPDDPTDLPWRKDPSPLATIAARSRLGPADHGRIMTLEKLLKADVEEGYRYGLARGVLEVSEVPKAPHRIVDCNL
jgi:hypothetical protein